MIVLCLACGGQKLIMDIEDCVSACFWKLSGRICPPPARRVCVSTCWCVFVHFEARSQTWLWFLSHCRVLPDLHLTESARQAGWWSPGIFLTLVPSTEITSTGHHAQFVRGFWGGITCVWIICQLLFQLSHLPSPEELVCLASESSLHS